MESKNNTKDSHQITIKKRQKRWRKELKGTTNTINKMAEKVHINNYFKYKWTKCTNQKTQSGWMDTKKKKKDPLLPTQDLLQM